MASSNDPTAAVEHSYPEKGPDTFQTTIHDKDNGSSKLDSIDGANPTNDDSIDTNVQPGVQNIEAVTVAWSKTWLMVAYALIWLIYFIQGLVATTVGSFLPYVTSDFALHSLTPTVGIISTVIGGVTNLSIAKILDIFGRPQGYLFSVILAVVGLIMSAACNNVEAYAASQ